MTLRPDPAGAPARTDRRPAFPKQPGIAGLFAFIDAVQRSRCTSMPETAAARLPHWLRM